MQIRFQNAPILIGDDSADDVFFVRRALKEIGCGERVYEVEDGKEVVDWLCAVGKYADRRTYPFPEVLLLDLKMPRYDGFYVLEWLQEHRECRVIPTIVFSSSVVEADVHRVYALGGNAYLVKPNGFNELAQVIRAIWTFWSLCQRPLPPKSGHC